MTMSLEQEGRLRVTLSREDLGRFGLSYDRLDYAGEETRRMVAVLLQSAGPVTGFRAGPGRLLIEVFPAPRQGCVLCFTRLDREVHRLRLRPVRDPLVFAFAESGSLLDAVARLYAAVGDISASRLTVGEDGYRLILSPPADRAGAVRLLLAEYGRELPPGRLAASRAAERGRVLCDAGAVGRLGRPLCGDQAPA